MIRGTPWQGRVRERRLLKKRFLQFRSLSDQGNSKEFITDIYSPIILFYFEFLCCYVEIQFGSPVETAHDVNKKS